MNRVLLTILAVGLLATQASAAMYELEAPLARQFTQLDTGDVEADLHLVIDKPGAFPGSTRHYYDGNPFTPDYGTTMQYAVGFVGTLGDFSPRDGVAAITIGQYDGSGLGLIGSYDGFAMAVANDDDDPWSVRAFVQTAGGTTYGDWITLGSGAASSASVNTGLIDFSGVIGIGFDVQGDFTGGSPSNPDYFHISVVPVPAAVLLGLLGLGAAGIRLRKFA